ncbi:MAG: esterase-like activity of phytase family protein [Bradyrhizobium sp.]|nr:esterase-like activity of phytase family protein [Bradyrhizobium sp.]
MQPGLLEPGLLGPSLLWSSLLGSRLLRSGLSRRRFLTSAAAGLSSAAMAALAQAQSAIEPPAKPLPPAPVSVTAPVAIEVNARPIPSFDPRDRSHVRFGSLQYRSGLVLTSPFPGFGGLSGLRLDRKGERFISFSDKGNWFTGRIVYRNTEMTGLADVEAAPMLGPDGRPITARGWYDSESIAIDGSQIYDSRVYIGLERVNQVLRFDFSKGFTRSLGEVVPMPLAVKKLPFNKGLEALVFVPGGMPLAGTLIALSERGLDANGNLVAFLVGGPSPGQFSVRRTEKFDISDATLLASGELLVLERKFSLVEGLNVRIRSIALKSLAPGALVDGPVIFEADLGEEIDNMEGIDAFVTPQGETVLTMVSDDNFSLIQRTLLLQFVLVD